MYEFKWDFFVVRDFNNRGDDQSRTKVFCHDFSSSDQFKLPFFMKFSIKTICFIFTFPNNYCDFQGVKDKLKSTDEWKRIGNHIVQLLIGILYNCEQSDKNSWFEYFEGYPH